MVLDAGNESPEARRPALEELCRRYWQPLCAYVRGHGLSEPDAEDMTQSFFVLLLERNLPGRVVPERGRFRAFLLAAIRNFMASQKRREQAQKRAGTTGAPLSLDDDALGLRDTIPCTETPEAAYDRKWAHTLIEIALDQLAEEQAALGESHRFATLRPLLFERGDNGAHVEPAARLGLSEGAVRTALSRLRASFRSHIRAEVARLVDDPAEIDDELAYLLRVLRS